MFKQLVDWLARIIRAVFGISHCALDNIKLVSVGDGAFAGNISEVLAGICRVTAVYEDESYAENIVVHYEITDGLAVFASNGEGTIDVRTDSSGHASVDIQIAARGYSIIRATIDGNARESAYFKVRSEGLIHQLSVYCESVVSAESGVINATIEAVDRNNRPVTGANLIFEAQCSIDTIITGEIVEDKPGVYLATAETTRAGPATIVVADEESAIVSTQIVNILPGPADSIRIIGSTDPRGSRPYGELSLQACLVDEFGNLIDPHHVTCDVDGQVSRRASIRGKSVFFPINSASNGDNTVRLYDEKSGVSKEIDVVFSPAWLGMPGLILVESRFETPVYLSPYVDKPVTSATIEIDFDSDMASFVSFTPNAGIDGLDAESGMVGNRLAISIKSESELGAEEFNNGIYIGTVTWECLGEGEVCFEVGGRMSPEFRKWKACPIQKRENPQCLCINTIYNEFDMVTWIRGLDAIGAFQREIFSEEHIELCCPFVRIVNYRCALRYSDWESMKRDHGIGVYWQGMYDEPTLFTSEEKSKFNVYNPCRKSKCMNIAFINFNTMPVEVKVDGQWKNVNGCVGMANGTAGASVGKHRIETPAVAHELLHLLGLDDIDDPEQSDNVMYHQYHEGLGYKIDRTQCRTIWDRLDTFKCD